MPPNGPCGDRTGHPASRRGGPGPGESLPGSFSTPRPWRRPFLGLFMLMSLWVGAPLCTWPFLVLLFPAVLSASPPPPPLLSLSQQPQEEKRRERRRRRRRRSSSTRGDKLLSAREDKHKIPVHEDDILHSAQRGPLLPVAISRLQHTYVFSRCFLVFQ